MKSGHQSNQESSLLAIPVGSNKVHCYTYFCFLCDIAAVGVTSSQVTVRFEEHKRMIVAGKIHPLQQRCVVLFMSSKSDHVIEEAKRRRLISISFYSFQIRGVWEGIVASKHSSQVSNSNSNAWRCRTRDFVIRRQSKAKLLACCGHGCSGISQPRLKPNKNKQMRI